MTSPMVIDFMKRRSCYITEIIDTVLDDFEEQGMKDTLEFKELEEVWHKAFAINQKYVKLEKKNRKKKE